MHELYVDEQLVELSLWDTAGACLCLPLSAFWTGKSDNQSCPPSCFVWLGQEEFDRLRSLSYAETHVIMICFSVRSHASSLHPEDLGCLMQRLCQVDNPTSLENVESKVSVSALY